MFKLQVVESPPEASMFSEAEGVHFKTTWIKAFWIRTQNAKTRETAFW